MKLFNLNNLFKTILNLVHALIHGDTLQNLVFKINCTWMAKRASNDNKGYHTPGGEL